MTEIVEGGPRDMDVTEDDLMMMGGLDDDLLNLDSFMPTNEELVADADLNMRRMASSGSMEMDITIPKMSDRLQEHLKNHPVVLNHDDDFNVDFDDASVVSKKDKTPVPSPAKTFHAIGKQKTPVPATTAPPEQEDEEEEELLVIPTKKVVDVKAETTPAVATPVPVVAKSPEKVPSSTEPTQKLPDDKVEKSPAKPIDSPNKATVAQNASTAPATPSATVAKAPEAPKSAEPAKEVIKVVDNKVAKTDNNTDTSHATHKPLTKQKSREEMLPGKLQKQVSEARLLAQAAAPVSTEDNMTDIEAMLLGDHPHRGDAPLARDAVEDDAVDDVVDAEAEELEEDVEELDIIHDNPHEHKSHRYSDNNLHNNHVSEEGEDLYLEQDEHFDDDAALEHHQQTQRKKDTAPNRKHRVTKPRKLVVTAQLQTSVDKNKDTAPRQPASSSPTQQPQQQQRAYQHPATQARFTVGGKQLSLVEAKLYGLVDADGSFKHPMQQLSSSGGSVHGSDNTNNSKGQRQKILQMAQPRADYANDVDLQEERPSFQPQRSEAAMKAMKNPRLGYDFMDRLGQGGNFLDRLQTDSHANQRYSKAQLDVMEADYAVKLDKLQCPMCHKEQSFVEMIENRRVCGPCQVKFVKLKVSSGQRFVQQNAEREAKRLAKLAKIDEEMYGMLPKPSTTVKLPAIPAKPSNAQSNSGNKGKANGAPPLLPPGPGDQNTDPHASSNQSSKNYSTNNNKHNQDKKNASSSHANSNSKRPTSASSRPAAATASSSAASAGPIMVPTTAASTAASVQQLVQLHQQKQQAVTKAFAALQQPAHETSSLASKNKSAGGSAAGAAASHPPSTREPKEISASRPSKAAGNASMHNASNAKNPSGTSGVSDPVARKMDRLMQLD